MEIALGRALWAEGLRYRKHTRNVFGKPDFTFKSVKIAVFIDSEYFHGKNWITEKNRIQTNREFWWPKIEGNMKRDLLVNKTLKDQGWKVIRFWSKDVEKKLPLCCAKILQTFEKRKNGL